MRRPSWLDPHATERRAWITTACLVILTTGAVIAALDIAQDILAPTALAILLAVTLSPVQSRLARNGLGEKLGAAATVLAVLAAIATATWALLPSYEEWRARGPALFREAGRLLSQMEKTVSETVEEVQSATGVKKAAAAETPATAPVADATQQTLFDWLLAAPGMAATVLFVAFLTFFLLAERRQVFRALTGLIASDFRGRLQIARALKQLNRDIARYFLLVSTINAGLGVCVAIAFTLVGMPNAALWGAAMALLNFVPYLGAAIANVVVFVVALVTFGSLSAALLPTVALLALNTLEGQLITPILVGRSVAGSAVMVFLSVAFGAWLWGAVGALLATPLLIVGKAVIVRLSNARHA